MKTHLPLLLACVVMNSFSPAALALPLVDRVWTGSAASGNWSVAANWQGGAPPQGGGNERLIFPLVTGRNSTNNLPTGLFFHTIWIQSGGYEIHGNRVRVRYLTAEFEYGSTTLGMDFQTQGGGLDDLDIELKVQNPVFLHLLGDIILDSGNALVIEGTGGILTLSGVISGPSPLVKRSRGDLILDGTRANTFTGSTYVEDGWVSLNKASLFPPGGLTAIPGNLYIGETSIVFTATVSLARDNQIADTALVDIEAGELSLNDYDETIGDLALDSSTVSTGTGLLTLSGNVSGSGDSTISGRLSLGNSTRRFYVTSNSTLRIPANIGAALGAVNAGIEKAIFPGTLRLSGTNTYLGPTTIESGTLTVANNAALGSASGGTTLHEGRLLLLNSEIANEPLVIDSDFNTLECAGASSWGGNIVLNGTALFNSGTGGVFRVTGAISGPGELRKTGAGILRLAGTTANTFEGVAQVNGGTLELQKPNGVAAIPNKLIVGLGGTPDSDVVRLFAGHQIAADALVNLSSSGLLDLNNFSETVRGVTNSGHVALGSGVLTVTNENVPREFSGRITGTGEFIKLGSGPFTLAGTNTYSGQTYIRGGTLLVNGTLASSFVQVQSGTLGGTGTVQSVAVSSAGAVSPGQSPGILNVAGNLSFLDGALQVELNGPGVGTGYDRLAVSDTVTLGAPTLNLSPGFVPALGTEFVILSRLSSGTISGTFAGLPEGGFIGAGGSAFQITYRGGTGNDVMLTRAPVPASRLTDIISVRNLKTVRGLGLASVSYTVQATTNLSPSIAWTTLGSDTADGSGMFQFLDTNSPLYQQRFYRAASP